jgi:hypothetical protein
VTKPVLSASASQVADRMILLFISILPILTGINSLEVICFTSKIQEIIK